MRIRQKILPLSLVYNIKGAAVAAVAGNLFNPLRGRVWPESQDGVKIRLPLTDYNAEIHSSSKAIHNYEQ
jgi:hypothetical protein